MEEYNDIILQAATLLKITLTGEECQLLAKQFHDFEELAKSLQKLDVANIIPASHSRNIDNSFYLTGSAAKLLREDFFSISPRVDEGFIRIARVLDSDENMQGIS